MRITPKRLLQSGLLLIGTVCLLQYVNHRRLNGNSTECSKRRPNDQRRLVYLTEKVHRALSIQMVPHFLCYESLWASLYNEGPRSWDHTVEMCLIGDSLTKQDEGFIARIFKTQDLQLEYDMLEGLYTVKLLPNIKFPDLPSAHEPDVSARLVLFQRRSNSMMMRKSGIKRALLPDDCENSLLECFPTSLAKEPLSSIKFGNNEFPAPREGIEIQKYHYPDDWWLQRKIPPVC